MIFRPYSVGHTIQVGDSRRGLVEEITLRHTVIKDFENQRIIIPNNVISDAIIVNASIIEPYILKHIEIGISYDSSIESAIAIMRETCQKHPKSLDRRTQEQIANNAEIIRVIVLSLGAYSVDLRAYVWVSSFDDSVTVKSDLLIAIKSEFEKNGVAIPFPTQIIHRK